MTGRELAQCINYNGMEKRIRKLALGEKLSSVESIAAMTTLEVCELVTKTYELVYAKDEEIGLVKKDKTKEYFSLLTKICR